MKKKILSKLRKNSNSTGTSVHAIGGLMHFGDAISGHDRFNSRILSDTFHTANDLGIHYNEI